MNRRNARIAFFFLNILFLGVIPSMLIWASGFYSCERYLVNMFKNLNIAISKEAVHIIAVDMNNWFLFMRTPFLVVWAIILSIIAINLLSIVIDFLSDI